MWGLYVSGIHIQKFPIGSLRYDIILAEIFKGVEEEDVCHLQESHMFFFSWLGCHINETIIHIAMGLDLDSFVKLGVEFLLLWFKDVN